MLRQNTAVDLILDSGAFSAWMKKIEIDIDEYIEFCLKYLQYITYIVNLDVIPGRYGQKNIPISEVERSAEKGWKNYEYILSKGIPKEKLIHVFHQGEKFKWLKQMVDNDMEYIGLSPANDRTTDEKIKWLDGCMEYVIDNKGYPRVKFHGFAVTSLRIMLRYPWYSVDSTSWVMTSRMGSVYVPRYRQGEYIYDQDSWKVAVSSRSPNKKEAGKHIESFPPAQRQIILDYFSHKGFSLGKSEFKKEGKGYKLKEGEKWFGKKEGDGSREVEVVVERGLCNDYKMRDEMNIIYFLDLEKSIPEWPWAFEAKNKMSGFGL